MLLSWDWRRIALVGSSARLCPAGSPVQRYDSVPCAVLLTMRMWLTALCVCSQRVMTVTDRSKADQPWSCAAHDQSIQIFSLPHNKHLN